MPDSEAQARCAERRSSRYRGVVAPAHEPATSAIFGLQTSWLRPGDEGRRAMSRRYLWKTGAPVDKAL